MSWLDPLSQGLLSLFNGLYGLVSAVFSPVTLLVAALAVSLAMMARYELHELDLQSRKPAVTRH